MSNTLTFNESSGFVLARKLRSTLAEMLRSEMAISLQDTGTKYYDPFSRVGLRIRMGLRLVTRRRIEASRVRAFG